MTLAVITIDKIDKNEDNYMHFKDKSQKAWNCNKPELIANFSEGERYYIDYNETKAKEGRKYGSKYINRARFWKPEDGPNTWPDKEPYTGGQSYSSAASGGFNKGGSMKQNDSERTHDIHKQVAAKCAMDYFVASGATIADLEASFPTVADIVLWYIEAAPKSANAGVDDEGSDGSSGSEHPPEEEFGF